MNFHDMILSQPIKHAIDDLGYTTPTEIQEKAIPTLIGSEDCHLFAQAKTGTGKTVAYAIPLAEKINPELRQVQAIVLVPTRELCKQVSEVLTAITKYCDLSVVEVYGGVSLFPQIEKIRNGAHIVIATPGRLIDIYKRRKINFDKVKYLILDEADQMLDMGFMPAVEVIMLKAMKGINPRLFLFSATLQGKIVQLASRFIRNGPKIEINVSHDTLTVESCAQFYYSVSNQESKFDEFIRILNQEHPSRSIIFVNTKRNAKKLVKKLRSVKDLDINPDLLNGDMSQLQRETVLKAFRNKELDCLIATDVASRGLDFADISHIFNYDIPSFEENYVHRIGRTSRMACQGTAISLCLPGQEHFLKKIERFAHIKILPRSLSASARAFKPKIIEPQVDHPDSNKNFLKDIQKGNITPNVIESQAGLPNPRMKQDNETWIKRPKKTSNQNRSSNKPSDFNESSRKPARFNKPYQKPSHFNGSSRKPSNSNGSSRKPARFNKPDQKPSQFNGSTQKPSNFNGSSRKPARFNKPDQKPSNRTISDKKPKSKDRILNQNGIIYLSN